MTRAPVRRTPQLRDPPERRPGRYVCPRCGFLLPFAGRISVGMVTCLQCWFRTDQRVAMLFEENV